MINYQSFQRTAGSNSSTPREFASIVDIMGFTRKLNAEIKVSSKKGVTLRFIWTPKGAQSASIITINCSNAVQKELEGEEFASATQALAHVATKYPVQVIRQDKEGVDYDVPLLKFAQIASAGEDITFADLAKLFKNAPVMESLAG